MISVIVPVYKVEQWLERCIHSILSQTYRDFELLLIDDGSPDRCGDMCELWAGKDVRIQVYHKPNGGLSDARNYGLDRVHGDYITFVDSDDWVAEDYLSYLRGLFDQCPAAGFVEGSLFEDRGTSSYARDDSGQVLCLPADKALEQLMYDRKLYVSACGKMFKRSMFEDLRFKKGAAYEDSYLYKRYFEKCEHMVYGGRPIYHYVVRDCSITTSSFNYKNLKDHFVSYDELSAYAVGRFPALAPARQRYLAFSRMRTLRQMKNVESEYWPLRDKLRKEVLVDAIPLLMNPKVPKRDKIGILSLIPGLWFYFWAWDVYSKFRK